MTTNYVVVRGSAPNSPIYIDCKECWEEDDSPNRISDHCNNLDDAQKLADSLDVAKIHGYRSSDADCKHCKEQRCICEGGTRSGHLNQAGGFCCQHWGNTCGYHSNYTSNIIPVG